MYECVNLALASNNKICFLYPINFPKVIMKLFCESHLAKSFMTKTDEEFFFRNNKQHGHSFAFENLNVTLRLLKPSHK